MRTVIFTSSSLRHKAFAAKASQSEVIDIVEIYSETWNSLNELDDKREDNLLQREHLLARNQSERDVFNWFYQLSQDQKFTINNVNRGWFSTNECRNAIRSINPDLILVYGTSIIKGGIIEDFSGRILNLHLGLSPYYRGAGTNYFPFVNGEPEFCGATYLYLDAGIDTGEIIHQIRPTIYQVDSFHQLSNRFLLKAYEAYISIAENFNKLEKLEPNPQLRVKEPHTPLKYYRNSDFTDESISQLYRNFSEGMLYNYLDHKASRDSFVPILTQPCLEH